MAKQVVFDQEQEHAHSTRNRRTTAARPSATALERLALRTGVVENTRAARQLFIVLIVLAAAGMVYVWVQSDSAANSYGNYESFSAEHPELAP